jgi:hypothetical protein
MRMAIPAVGVVLASLAVTACGSSSSASSSGTPTTTTTTAANNRADIAACMRKHGVTLPNRPAGAGRPGGTTGPGGPGGPGGGGFLLGGGGGGGAGGGQQGQGRGQFNNPKFQAAAKKCGLNFNRAGNGGPGRFNPTSNPQFKKSLTKFVACVRKNGYDLPSPNLSGNGPVFDASKVNRNDPKFVKAAQKCQSLLSFGRGTTGQGGPPPAQ